VVSSTEDDSVGPPADEVPAGPQRWPRRLWAAVTVLLVLAASTAVVVAATIESRHNAQKERTAFQLASQNVASSLKLAIERESDLVVSVDGFVDEDPNASNEAFLQWTQAVQVFERYPEILELGHVVVVRPSALAAFAARAERDPAGTLPADGVFRVLPGGHRSFYCLAVGVTVRETQAAVPAGRDYCSGGTLKIGTSAAIPFHEGGVTLLSVLAPVFRGGLVPPTAAARGSAFLGWVGVAVVPEVLLDQALAGHPGTAVRFSYHVGTASAVFHSGSVPRHAQTATIDLRNGWTVTTYGAVSGTGLFAHGRPGALLVVGILVSFLLGILLFALGTGGARARRLVTVKTGELLHQTLHDGLTGLPNRALITDRVEQLLSRSRRNGTVGAVLFVDLDQFKAVNDSLGHGVGDQLLQAVAARLKMGLRAVDTVGRLGGDEFVVLIDGNPHIAPELVAERILGVMRQPFQLEGASSLITITASIGAASGLRSTAGELLRDADMALYRAKALGKDRYEVFRPEMEAALRHRLAIELDLRSALAAGQFRLVYQPTYNLDDLSLVGVEALLRWQHPTHGVIGPDEFIPLLESSGQIVEVGRWVLATACLQMAIWHARGCHLALAVNVSVRQLDDDVILTDVRDALELSRLDPWKLMIEITETALMRNVDGTSRRLHAIKELGVNLAIDDFGTGYSSLASLQRFPIDTIKIDRAFTDALERSPESDALIRILVQLGRDLGLKTLAEGVETVGQLDHLRQEHIDEVQGFLLSRPLDVEAIESLILPDDGTPPGAGDAVAVEPGVVMASLTATSRAAGTGS
jgi:diguanylate cyclase (GGDEF)-like protein